MFSLRNGITNNLITFISKFNIHSKENKKSSIVSKDKHEIYNIFNHKVPLETSRIKNTFGITAIDFITAFSALYSKVKFTKTPFILKALIGAQISVNVYKHLLRGKFMLSSHYEKVAKTEQKIMSSPFIKFFVNANMKEMMFSTAITYILGKTIYTTSPKMFNKLMVLGIGGSLMTNNINKYSKRRIKDRMNINNFEVFPNHFNIIPNILVSHSLMSLFDYFTIGNKVITKTNFFFDKYNFLSYLYYISTGKMLRFLSFFTTSSINSLSSENIFSTLLLMSTSQRRAKYILPWTLMHYFNPYSMWIFLKAKNSLYQEEIDRIFRKKNFLQKILVYFKYTTYNTFSYTVNI